MTYGTGSLASSRRSVRCQPLAARSSDQRVPAGVTSLPAASKIAAGAMRRPAKRAPAWRSIEPSCLNCGSRVVIPSRQVQVRMPTRRLTLKSSSVRSVPIVTVSWPNGVGREAPCSKACHAAWPAPTAVRESVWPFRRTTVRLRSTATATPAAGRRASGASARAAPSASCRNGAEEGCAFAGPDCGPITKSQAPRRSAATKAITAMLTPPAFAGRFLGRSSRKLAMVGLGCAPSLTREKVCSSPIGLRVRRLDTRTLRTPKIPRPG